MEAPTRDDIIQLVKQNLPNADASSVLAILDEYGADMPERERVQLAIVRWSGYNASLDHVRCTTDRAKQDYLGILEAATARPTREEVISAVRQSFPNEDQARMMALLDEFGSDLWIPERERVQLAILQLSGGDIDSVRRGVEAARRDYHDVLWDEEELASTSEERS